MATENPSRQQSGDRSSTGSSTTQQGTAQGSSSQNPASGAGSQQQAYDSSTTSGSVAGTRGTQQSYGSTTAQGAGWQERGGRGAQSGASMPSRRASFYEPSLYSNYGRGYGAGPFSLMRRISDEMDRLFESFGMSTLPQDYGRGASQFTGQTPALWTPHIEVRERNGKLLIQADLPGVRKEDVNVEIEHDQVIIQGQREEERTENERGYYHTERSYGSFYRAIQLPEGVDAENAKASFRDGVLEIELPAPQQRSQTRRLEIQDATGSGGQYSTGTASTGGQASSGSTGGVRDYGSASQAGGSIGSSGSSGRSGGSA